MLMALELLGHPGGDFFSEIRDVGRIGANGEIHNSLLSVASEFLVSSFWFLVGGVVGN